MSIAAATGKECVAALRRYLPRAHGLIRTELRELSVALVGDATMSGIHERFMGIKGPTDVMSFTLETDRRGRVVAGELVVCVAAARRQARRRGIAVWREVVLYALHGLLHLSGFDDRTESEYRKMHLMEDRILMELGIGATFSTTYLSACRGEAGLALLAKERGRGMPRPYMKGEGAKRGKR